jgi:hypothetical protein
MPLAAYLIAWLPFMCKTLRHTPTTPGYSAGESDHGEEPAVLRMRPHLRWAGRGSLPAMLRCISCIESLLAGCTS